MHMTADKFSVALDIAKIEVEAISKPSEDDVDETYYRTFRFTTFNGEVLEVLCSAGDETFVQMQEVATLPPLRRKPHPLNWLHPKKS